MIFGFRLLFAAALVSRLPSASCHVRSDAVVGTWVGEVSQGETKFETRLTFVSPKGGVSRYPSFPCGGTLSGDRKGDAYEFNEVITWGGLDERPNGCIGGVVENLGRWGQDDVRLVRNLQWHGSCCGG